MKGAGGREGGRKKGKKKFQREREGREKRHSHSGTTENRRGLQGAKISQIQEHALAGVVWDL